MVPGSEHIYPKGLSGIANVDFSPETTRRQLFMDELQQWLILDCPLKVTIRSHLL